MSYASLEKYQQWMTKVKSIRKIPVFESMMGIADLNKKAPSSIAKTAKVTNLRIGRRVFHGISFETLQINMQYFLQELLALCQDKGVIIHEKWFNNEAEILNL